MSGAIHVDSVHVLMSFDAALARASEAINEGTGPVKAEAERKIELLASRRRRLERKLDRFEEVLSEADDEYDDTSGLECALEDAREQLECCIHWQQRVDEVYEQYAAQAHKLGRLASERTDAARNFIRSRIRDLEDYLAEQLGGNTGAAGPPSVVSDSGFAMPLPEMPVPGSIAENVGDDQSAAPSFAAREVSSGDFAWFCPADVEISDGETLSWQRLSKASAGGSFESAGRFRAYVDMDCIRSYADFQDARGRLEAVVDEDGRHVFSGDDMRFFDLYFGSQKIRIDALDGNFDVVNGRHRLWMAQNLGVRSLPVSLTPQAKELLQSKIRDQEA